MERAATEHTEVDQEFINQFVIASHFDLEKVKAILPMHPELLNANAVWTETPVQAASHMGNREIINYLLEAGAPLDVFTACALGMTDRVGRFLDEDPSLINAPGVHGFPILYFAAVGGDVPVADLLESRGARVDTGSGGNTLLHGAAGFGKLEMTRWLLDRGVDVNAPGFENKTALQMAESNGHTEVATLLRERGATS